MIISVGFYAATFDANRSSFEAAGRLNRAILRWIVLQDGDVQATMPCHMGRALLMRRICRRGWRAEKYWCVPQRDAPGHSFNSGLATLLSTSVKKIEN